MEIGVPFSDPMADGPVIQRAMERALARGTSLPQILALCARLREEVPLPIVILSYLNPLLQHGAERFAREARAAGVDGVIVPDLPWGEAPFFEKELRAQGVFLIPLVAPTTREERLREIGAEARGFVYCVSLTGVTGARESLRPDIGAFLERVRRHCPQPLAVGFGIAHPWQARAVASHADGVVVGSAFVALAEEWAGNRAGLAAAIGRLASEMRQALDG